MSKIRICFMGTPDFALKAFQGLLADDHYEVVGVVTQPDRPAGRKLVLTPSPVKKLAIEKNIPVLTPESIRKNPECMEVIKSWKAEIAVVVAFGQILSQEVIDLFPLGCVNLHGSLLPKWRGAAPIQRSIEAGDAETGVALQKMVLKLDAGDVLGVRRILLSENMNAQELHDLMAEKGVELLHIELMDYIRGNLNPHPQDESHVTFAKKIEKTESEIQWQHPARQIHQKVNAFVMGPGTWTILKDKKIKIHETRIYDESLKTKSAPGEIVNDPHKLLVQANPGVLELTIVQPESRTKIPGSEFLKGIKS